MKSKDYVSIKIAKKLKSKGYNVLCDSFFAKIYDYKIIYCPTACSTSAVTYNDLAEKDILRPTIYDVISWLIEQYGIYIYSYYDDYFDICIIDMYGQYNSNNCTSYALLVEAENNMIFENNHEALLYGINKALDYIK